MTLLTGKTFLSFVLVVFLVTTDTVQRGLAHTGQVLVAGLALDRRQRVRVTQDELGPVVTKASNRGFPVTLAMAITALLAERPVVLIVFLVTRQALSGGFLEHCALVALLAFHFGVLAQQGEAAQIVIKLLRRFLPVALVVATHAVLTQRSFVLVIPGMTGVAVRTQLDPIQVAGMTCRAGGCNVFAAQQVFGIGVVIELDGFPELDAMAGFALFTIQALMAFGAIVVLFVATDAGARRILVIAPGLVTLDALHIDVFFRQGKPRRSMVKLELFPVGLIVAISTLGAQ